VYIIIQLLISSSEYVPKKLVSWKWRTGNGDQVSDICTHYTQKTVTHKNAV